MKRWLVRTIWAALLIFATVVIGGAVDARRRLPDLESWHRYVPADATASDLETATLAEYLRREDTVFRDVRDRIERTSAGSALPPANRYDSRSRSHPSRIGSDGNRTYEIVPDGEIVGGALLIHGLTDSPYTMRAVGETLKASGYYGLALRMPGHGTVPAALTTAVWEDWLAAVRVGVRHVLERIGPDKPLVLVGYSNGGALVLKYALDEVERGARPRATRLALISPMIGVAPFAWMSRVISLLGPIPYFEKARWLDVMPEYNPFKYNSFPANAALQSWRLSTDVQAQILRLGKAGRLKDLPPVLAFQSLVDATVSTDAVVHALFDQLDDNGSELVLFDINRLSGMEPFIEPASAAILSGLTDASPRRYGRALVTNAGRDSLEVVERSIRPDRTEIATRPLGLAWPPEMFSLAHIALPFTLDDDVYGANPRPSSFDVVRLGTLSPRGERAVLTVPLDTLMRASCNPFFPYLAARVTAWIDQRKQGGTARMIVAPLVLLAALAGRLAATSSTELQSARDFGCTEWHDCRRLALAAADRGDYETFHDLAWRAIQTGPPKDPALMFLLARAQALSGRPHDALIMLQRLADMGVPSDVAANDEFVRTRQLPGWPEVSASIERLTHPDSPSPASHRRRGAEAIANGAIARSRDCPVIGIPTFALVILGAGPGQRPILDREFYAGRARLRRGLAPVPGWRSARAQADGGGRGRQSCGGLRSRRLSGISRHRGDRD